MSFLLENVHFWIVIIFVDYSNFCFDKCRLLEIVSGTVFQSFNFCLGWRFIGLWNKGKENYTCSILIPSSWLGCIQSLLVVIALPRDPLQCFVASKKKKNWLLYSFINCKYICIWGFKEVIDAGVCGCFFESCFARFLINILRTYLTFYFLMSLWCPLMFYICGNMGQDVRSKE